MTGKYLITTDNYFLCPDGKHYKAVWGEVKVLGDKEALGIETNRNSSNWFAMVGNESKQVLIAGCQIHYAVRSETPPTLSGLIEEYREGKLETRENIIYIAEDIEIPVLGSNIETVEDIPNNFEDNSVGSKYWMSRDGESALDSGAKDPDEMVKSKQLEVEAGNKILIMTKTKDLTIWEKVEYNGITSAMFFGEFLKYNPSIINQMYHLESIEAFKNIQNSFKKGKNMFDIYKIEIGTSPAGTRYIDIHFKNLAPFSANLTPF